MRAATTLNAAGKTDPGLQRAVNEDRLYVDAARGLFIVIDGVGGQAAGGKAADIALSVLRSRLERDTGSVATRLREAITFANNEIYRQARTRAEWNGMACVVTVVVADDVQATIGHVGDTRLYKLSANGIRKVTRDHSPVGEREDAGEISEREAMRHPRRNEVYRDVGSDLHEPGDPEFVEVGEIRFEPDSALLLCSDGLSDLVDSSTIERLVKQFAGDPNRVVAALVDAAIGAGGKDNVTVVYVEGEEFKAAAARSLAAEITRRLGNRVETDAIERKPFPSRVVRIALLVVTAILLTVSVVEPPVRPIVGADATATSRSTTSRFIVRPGGSIAAALREASPGGVVVVEPGEYREAITLASDVRLVSRIPRGAILRLPSSAGESDAAAVALGITGASLVGFRIVGDAATPLGTGLLVQDSELSVIDSDISGASTVAIDIAGASHVTVMASYVHDNPGAALAIRSAGSARITHNVFERNSESPYTPMPIIVGETATISIAANVFSGMSASLQSMTGPVRAALVRENWLLDREAPRPDSPAHARGQRGAER